MNLAHSDIGDLAGLVLARPLFGPEIAVAATDPRASHHRPLAQESGATVRMSPIRRRAYAAGRVAAHDCMTGLGRNVQPVLTTPDRAPLWPEGLTGSISHSQSCCIAALGQTTDVQSLGVDVEEATGIDDDLIGIVCTQTEKAWLSTRSRERAGVLGKLIFSAKECAYKCQYPLSKTLFGFDTFDITPDLDTGQFEATFLCDVPHFRAGTHLCGRFAIAQGLIVTAMAIAA
jgi:4'-phosphopantetheinyl transferase EntD